jgi:hypothetical protein
MMIDVTPYLVDPKHCFDLVPCIGYGCQVILLLICLYYSRKKIK